MIKNQRAHRSENYCNDELLGLISVSCQHPGVNGWDFAHSPWMTVGTKTDRMPFHNFSGT